VAGKALLRVAEEAIHQATVVVKILHREEAQMGAKAPAPVDN
jgi:hypothetical protein